MDQKATYQAVMDIRAIDELIATGIFDAVLDSSRLRKAAFTELVIRLGELVSRCESEGKPVAFTDDVIVTDDVKNAGDLIAFIREELCHTGLRNEYGSAFRYATVRGRMPPIAIGGESAIGGCDYDDDIAYCFGSQRIYWKRHVLRAFEQVKATLAPPGSEVEKNI